MEFHIIVGLTNNSQNIMDYRITFIRSAIKIEKLKGVIIMPHIIIKGMSIVEVQKISKQMMDELEIIIGCPREYFTLEVVESTFIVDGEKVHKDPFVQINWFDRGPQIQDKTAVAITEHICNAGYRNVEMFFTILERHRYYENGKLL